MAHALRQQTSNVEMECGPGLAGLNSQRCDSCRRKHWACMALVACLLGLRGNQHTARLELLCRLTPPVASESYLAEPLDIASRCLASSLLALVKCLCMRNVVARGPSMPSAALARSVSHVMLTVHGARSKRHAHSVPGVSVAMLVRGCPMVDKQLVIATRARSLPIVLRSMFISELWRDPCRAPT